MREIFAKLLDPYLLYLSIFYILFRLTVYNCSATLYFPALLLWRTNASTTFSKYSKDREEKRCEYERPSTELKSWQIYIHRNWSQNLCERPAVFEYGQLFQHSLPELQQNMSSSLTNFWSRIQGVYISESSTFIDIYHLVLNEFGQWHDFERNLTYWLFL